MARLARQNVPRNSKNAAKICGNKKLRVQCTATNLNLNNCRARTGAYKKVFVFFVFKMCLFLKNSAAFMFCE